MPTYSTSTTTTSFTPIYTATTIGPSLYVSSTNNEEKIKEYTDKTDKHVDELEADIEFLNNERKRMDEILKSQVLLNAELDSKISALTKICTDLQSHINFLEVRIGELEHGAN